MLDMADPNHHARKLVGILVYLDAEQLPRVDASLRCVDSRFYRPTQHLPLQAVQQVQAHI